MWEQAGKTANLNAQWKVFSARVNKKCPGVNCLAEGNCMQREAIIKRKTRETDVSCEIDIDGKGESEIKSGNAFLDHMLTLFAAHGLFDCRIFCKGDIEVDMHHSVEDIGICLGEALLKACGDKKGINRYGSAYVPMDESLARVCCDFCGRPNLSYNVKLSSSRVNKFECELVEDFFKAFTDHARMTLHVDLIRGRNSHHSLEAIFKAFGRALSEACGLNPKAINAIPSSKGVL
jgi:imidazoleglycerol-phosphate dehydratase